MPQSLTSLNCYHAGGALVHLTKAAAQVSYALAGRLVYSGGWLTLTVPAALVRGAYDALHEPGAELPTMFGIPVMSPQELDEIGGADKVTERGHSYTYSLGPVKEYEPGEGLSKTYFIEVTSPDLKTLRQTYGLESYPRGIYAFRLPIAVRRRGVLAANDISKTAEYLGDLDPEEFDMSAVKEAVFPRLQAPPAPPRPIFGGLFEGLGSAFGTVGKTLTNAAGVDPQTLGSVATHVATPAADAADSVAHAFGEITPRDLVLGFLKQKAWQAAPYAGGAAALGALGAAYWMNRRRKRKQDATTQASLTPQEKEARAPLKPVMSMYNSLRLGAPTPAALAAPVASAAPAVASAPAAAGGVRGYLRAMAAVAGLAGAAFAAGR